MASEETTDAPAGSSNEAEKQLPPEVEALFPKDGVFDEDLWDEYQHSIKTYRSDKDLERVSSELEYVVYEKFAGVCQDQLLNLKLYGGQYKLGRAICSPHPAHPNRERFTSIDWVDLDPIKYVPIIRDINIEMARGTVLGDKWGINFRWLQMAPIIKRFLEEQRGIILQKSMVDVDWDGEKETLYRMAFEPFSLSICPDGSSGWRWRYFVAGSSGKIREINRNIVRGDSSDIVLYNDECYFIHPYGVSKIEYDIDSNKASRRVLCRFKLSEEF